MKLSRNLRRALSAALLLTPAGSAFAQLDVTNNRLFEVGTIAVATPPNSDRSFAEALAIGDFDCDGFDDVAIGSPNVTANGAIDAGAVVVLYGSVAGLSTTGAQQWTQSSPGVPGGSEDHDRFGSKLAAGKLSSDSCDELVIGAENEALGDPVLFNVGAVTMLRGNAAGLTSTGAVFLPRSDETGDNGPQSNDHYAAALAIGDVVSLGGSLHELIGGVIFDSPGLFVDRGGSIDIRRASSSEPLEGRVGRFNQDQDNVSQIESGDNFGAALAIGDFDNDGIKDIAIGAPGEDTAGIDSVGAVTVMYGSAVPFGSGGTLTFDQETAGVPGVNEAGDALGSVLAAGDFDADGDDDLVIGLPFEDIGGGFNDGSVVVRNGRSSGGVNGFDASLSFDAVQFGISSPGSPTVMGSALAVGDFNDDGFADLAMGAPGAVDGSSNSAGKVVVLYGQASGLTISGAQIWHQGVTAIPGSPTSLDFFGAGLGSGDFDGNGVDDLVIGIPGEDSVGGSQGAVQVLYGFSSAPRPDPIFASRFE